MNTENEMLNGEAMNIINKIGKKVYDKMRNGFRSHLFSILQHRIIKEQIKTSITRIIKSKMKNDEFDKEYNNDVKYFIWLNKDNIKNLITKIYELNRYINDAFDLGRN